MFLKRYISLKKLVDICIIGVIAMLVLYFVWSTSNGATDGYAWNWPSLWKYFVWRDDTGSLHTGLLLQGVFTTLQIALWAMLLAAFLGLLSGFMHCSQWLFFRLIAKTYVGVARNIPPLVLVFAIHFFIVTLFSPYIPWADIRSFLREIPGASFFLPLSSNLSFFFSAVVSLGLYEGAYISEVVRAGLESVPKVQWEAASSLGLSRRLTLVNVILPQAFRMMLPPLVSQSVSLIKDSSIVSVISVAELTYQGRELMNTTFMVFEIWMSITLIYLLICLIISTLGHILERRSKWRII